jgi:hypothetical protein
VGLTLGRRPKQVKVPWNAHEQKLFLEAIEKYGHKRMREIAEYIGSRTHI